MDFYKTIGNPVQTKIVVKKSTFLSFALPIENEQEAQDRIRSFRKQFYDARHVCYAYQLGVEPVLSKASDNGEPSGTASRPMLGAIQSAGLTNVLVVVVRYFGGILLGTPGLIAAYREGATSALRQAEVVQKAQLLEAVIKFPYATLNSVMRILKQNDVQISESQMELDCRLSIKAPKSIMENTLSQLSKIHSVEIID